MTRQAHIIKRQVIELHLSPDMDHHAIQDRVAALYHQKLLGLIDAFLSRITEDGQTAKIAQLQLDLGEININRLETALTQNLETELQQKFPRLVRQFAVSATEDEAGEPVKSSGSDLDLVTYFLQTGLLPWWAVENSLRVAEDAFDRAMLHEASSLKKIIRRLFRDEAVVKRFVYSFGTKIHDQLIELFLPGAAADSKAFEADLVLLLQSSSASNQFRNEFRCGLFQTIVDENVPLDDYRMATSLKIFSLLHQQNKQRYQEPVGLLQVMLALEKPASFFTYEQAKHDLAEIRSGLATLQQAATPDGREKIENCREKLARFTAFWNGFVQGQKKNLHLDLQVVTAFLAGIDNELSKALFNKQANATIKTKEKESREDSNESSRPDDKSNAFDTTDKVYIENAGLVLLWPFLTRFFTNLDLANDKAFSDAVAAEKACVLLQHLVQAGSEELFEAQLPLNKVLCGIPLQEPVNTGITITPGEAEAGDHFLAAVIQHGPLWKDLSINGFRQAYLRREGALGTRDGNWLLQVKRETYDVIVDRLPWSVQVVKLPWMKNLLFVEWQQT